MSYLKEDFLLKGKTAQRLYETYAKNQPIFDYHCHLSEKEILANEPFEDVYSVWLKGDHYKWRLMRNYGVDERYITGDATNKEKFIAYCTAVSTAFGNPLYHWSQVELKEYMNCELEICKENAEQIWDWCNEYIRLNKLTPQKLIEGSNVCKLFTTNEVFDDLSTFEKIKEKGYAFEVAPAFRADKVMNIEADGYETVLEKLGGVSDLTALERVLEQRLQAFLKVGAKATDIALQKVLPVPDRADAETVFADKKQGKSLSSVQADIFKGYLTYFLFRLYAKYNLVTELHIGAMRNNNTNAFQTLGADTGYDSVAEDNSIQNLSKLFDKLNTENALPKTIVFNLNPKMNSEIITLLGCFQSGEAKGKMQYGAAWWFLDNKVGMERHLADLTATGHLGAFVGMLTDSRSFLSYPRHHYFRRILCSYLGKMMDEGEMTGDETRVGEVVKDICYRNAREYFN